MKLYGSLQYRGKRIYLNRKTLKENGEWQWAQESTGLNRGDEDAARTLLNDRNIEELARFELRAKVVGGAGRTQTIRGYSIRWIDLRKRRELTSAFEDERRFQTHIWPVRIDDIVRLGDIPLGAVRASHVRQWVAHLQRQALAPRTVRNLYSLLHAMFADAYADEIVDANPCRAAVRRSATIGRQRSAMARFGDFYAG